MKDKKHNHKLTDLLKFTIFALLMLLPFGAIGIKCGYAVFNKNAYLNYSGRQYDQYTSIAYNEMQLGHLYHWSNDLLPNTTYTGNATDIYMTGITNVIGATNNITIADRLRVYRSGTTYMYLAFYEGQNSVAYINAQTTAISFDFTLTALQNAGSNDSITAFPCFYTIQNSQTNYLDNVFYASVDDLKNHTIFSWSQNTGVYTAINTMTTGLGIQETTMPILLSYWTMLTAIYVVFDIIIGTFTMITHMISEKTA